VSWLPFVGHLAVLVLYAAGGAWLAQRTFARRLLP
jgi:uncharacterized protein YneF (UPF0154 family)